MVTVDLERLKEVAPYIIIMGLGVGIIVSFYLYFFHHRVRSFLKAREERKIREIAYKVRLVLESDSQFIQDISRQIRR